MSRRWVLMLALALCAPQWTFAEGGVLHISPEAAVRSIGDVFEVQVLLDSGGAEVNAAEAEIEFNPSALAVERVSTKDSLLALWPTAPYYSNDEGVVKFSGLMEESFEGENGLLITMTFRALRNMTSNVRLASGAILASDGQGSNVITGLKSGVFTVRPQELEAVADLDVSPREEATSPLVKPVFQPSENFIAVGNYIVFNGAAPPNSPVSVWLQKGTGQEVRTDVMTSEDGFFSFVSSQEATEGVYHVWAAIREPGGGWGPSSDRQRVTVRATGLLASALFGVSLLTELLPFLGLLVIGGLGVGYLFHRHKVEKMKHGIH